MERQNRQLGRPCSFSSADMIMSPCARLCQRQGQPQGKKTRTDACASSQCSHARVARAGQAVCAQQCVCSQVDPELWRLRPPTQQACIPQAVPYTEVRVMGVTAEGALPVLVLRPLSRSLKAWPVFVYVSPYKGCNILICTPIPIIHGSLHAAAVWSSGGSTAAAGLCLCLYGLAPPSSSTAYVRAQRIDFSSASV